MQQKWLALEKTPPTPAAVAAAAEATAAASAAAAAAGKAAPAPVAPFSEPRVVRKVRVCFSHAARDCGDWIDHDDGNIFHAKCVCVCACKQRSCFFGCQTQCRACVVR